METSLPPEAGLSIWAARLAASLQVERDLADEFLAAQETRLQRAETVLEEELSRLEEQVLSAEVGAATGSPVGVEVQLPPQPQPDKLDWEAEKRRILAALESDFGEDDADRQVAIDRALDLDAAVGEEGSPLRQLQDQWWEKLRQAEVELSLERAKLARQRAGLEEQAQSAQSDLPPAADGTAPPARGRWLAKLGLSEADRVRRRKS